MKLHRDRFILFFVLCLVFSSAWVVPAFAQTGGEVPLSYAPWQRQTPSSVFAKTITVSKVKFSKNKINVNIGKNYDLKTKLKITPSAAEDKSVLWTSNKPMVATVDANGIVKVVGEGTATITATSKANPAKKDTVKIVGKAVRVKSIALGIKNLTLDAGKSYTVSSTIKPVAATFRDITWTQSDATVATVDANGIVRAHAPGKSIITARTDKGKKKATVTVRVRGGTMQTVKLSAVGDCVIGGDTRRVKRADDVYGDGLTSYKRFEKYYREKGPNYFFQNVRDVFLNDDVTVINFEGTLTNRKSHYSKTFAFRGPPEYKNLVRDAGVDVATLANNHGLDFMQAGYNDTRKHLNSVDIRSYGTGSGRVVTRVVNGVRIGFAGFVMPASYSDVAASIRSLKREKKCKMVVVSFHWTKSKEWTTNTTSKERAAARYAIKHGADLVLGHHKHAIGGIEKYKGKMIAYDLGNFIAMIRNQLVPGAPFTDKDTMIFQQKFNIFSDGYIEYVDPNIIPCMNSDTQDTMTGNPRIVSGDDADRVLDKVRARSTVANRGLVKYSASY